MLVNDNRNLDDLLKVIREFKGENKEELKMLVKATEKLEAIRVELEMAKRDYQKSWRSTFKENFKLCALLSFFVLLLIGAISIPASFSLQFGSFKAEKTQSCNS